MRSFIFTCLFFTAAACGTTHTIDGNDQLDAPVGKEDAASVPSGAYSNAQAYYGELASLSLDADHTFKRSEIVACAGGGTCDPIVDTGTYLFTHSSTKHYIRFYAADGTSLDRYQWKLSASGALQLERDGSDHWFTLTQGASCDAAGGTCVPLVPDACEFGSIGDASEYSCGGGVGVECCLPLQPDNRCNVDSDCKGFLPQFCRACGDGTTACAHWSCVANACQLASCAN